MRIDLYLTEQELSIVKDNSIVSQAMELIWCGIIGRYGFTIPMIMPKIQHGKGNHYIIHY